MAKKILYQDNARRALERGMEIMVEAVSVTLGPKGRNVVLEKAYGSPQIVNDGVTIAKEINLPDHIENTGVSLIRQAASKTTFRPLGPNVTDTASTIISIPRSNARRASS